MRTKMRMVITGVCTSLMTALAVVPASAQGGPDAPVTITYNPEGRPMRVTATYYPATRTMDTENKYTDGSPLTLVFHDDGTVTDALLGQKMGTITANGSFSSSMVKGLRINRQGYVTWNGEQMGRITDDGEILLYGIHIADINGEMPKEYAAYYMFSRFFGADGLRALRKRVAEIDAINAQAEAEYEAELERNPMRKRPSDMRSKRMDLYYRNRYVGRVGLDGTVTIHDRQVMRITSDGNIYVGSSCEGHIDHDGTVRRRYTIIGRVKDNGEVIEGTRYVGSIRSNGDVYYRNTFVGRVSNMSDRRWAALIYFFGFIKL